MCSQQLSGLSNPGNVFDAFLLQKMAVIGSLAEKQKIMQEVDSTISTVHECLEFNSFQMLGLLYR